MTLQTIAGGGLWGNPLPDTVLAALAFTSILMDANGEKVAFCGHVFSKDRSSKNITKVGLLPGTVTLNSASVIRVSIQSLSQTASFTEPSGTILGATGNGYVDESATTWTTNTWHQTAALGETVTVTDGQEIAVVVEYQPFTTGDILNIRGLTQQQAWNFPASKLYTTSWGGQAVTPNVILEFDDGTFGTIEGAFPCSAVAAISAYGSTSNPDEYAMEFQVPFPCKVDAFQLDMGINGATSNFEVILYDGTTAMTNGTAAFDGSVMGTNTQRLMCGRFPGQVQLSANTTYRLALKPTTSNSVNFYYFDVANANHLQAHSFGTTGCLTSRVDAGSWAAATTTRRPMFSIRFSAFGDDAGGGGSGMLYVPNMDGV
jgi:hypothetical protein